VGVTVQVAGQGMSAGASTWDATRAHAAVTELRTRVDVVVVESHAGLEYLKRPDPPLAHVPSAVKKPGPSPDPSPVDALTVRRGIPEDQARALLIQAFVGEAVERIEHEGLREALSKASAEWLGVTFD